MEQFQEFHDGMDSARRRRFELSQRLNRRYIPRSRDRDLGREIQQWVDLTLASIGEAHPEGRILAVTGASGAGKTRAIERAIKAVPGLSNAILTVTAPRPCTLKQLGRETLKELGYPLQRDLREHLTWEKVRDHLEANQVRFVWVDELQHTLDGKNGPQVAAISDTFKNLAQRRKWPISFLFSGLPAVSHFLGRDRQIERRSRTIEFGPISFPASTKLIRNQLLPSIIEEDAGMQIGDLATDEFVHRLCHAAAGAFGVAADLVRLAVLNAIDRKDFDGSILIGDFAAAYAAERGCERSENVFLVHNWHEVLPENSRLRVDTSMGGR